MTREELVAAVLKNPGALYDIVTRCHKIAGPWVRTETESRRLLHPNGYTTFASCRVHGDGKVYALKWYALNGNLRGEPGFDTREEAETYADEQLAIKGYAVAPEAE